LNGESKHDIKEKIRQRYKGGDTENMHMIPARPKESLFEENTEKKVCAYCRVSTDDPRQTSSYGKVYLSPVIDCFDGLVVTWKTSRNPNADLTNGMLSEAVSTLKARQKPILHTDRGVHYRWDSWIQIMKQAGLTRSMSRKACSPDNAACEGFFGRLKN